MHEFSLCQGIIKEISKANRDTLKNINEVIVEIGDLANVDIASLCFWFPVVAKNAGYQDIKLTVSRIAGLVKCMNCLYEFNLSNLYEPCPNCNKFGNYNIIQGNELMVKSYSIG